MGIIGKLSSLWSGSPSAPSARPWQPDPYYGLKGGRYTGPGGQRMLQGDEALFNAVMSNLQREPGYSERDIELMYLQPAEQTKAGETAALRSLNRTAAATGRFGAGSTERGRGQILSEGMRTRADLRRQTRLDAARAALEDRYRQMAALSGYVSPRLAGAQQESLARNQYAMGLNRLDLSRWLAEQEQYNQDFAWSWDKLSKAAQAAMGAYG